MRPVRVFSTVAIAAFMFVLAACSTPAAHAEDGEESGPDGIAVIGLPGLEWSDINDTDTPVLYELAGQSAVASMSVRTIGAWTCPEAAWTTIGTGNRAGGAGARTSDCFEQSVFSNPISLGGSWLLPDAIERVAINEFYAYGSEVGAVAQSVHDARTEVDSAQDADRNISHDDLCVSAIGPGAAVAAANPEGQLDFWRDDLSSVSYGADECPIVLIDPGVSIGISPQSAHEVEYDASESGEDHQPDNGDDVGLDDETIDPDNNEAEEEAQEREDDQRYTQAATADAALASALHQIPDNFDVIVAGISDSHSPTSLHPFMYTGEDVSANWASSPTTGREGYVQIVDIAPTILRTVDIDLPSSMAGRGINASGPATTGAADTVDEGMSHTNASSSVAEAMPGFFMTIAVAGILAVVAATAVAARRFDPSPARLISVGFLTIASLPLAAVAAGVIPWWQTGAPVATFWALTLSMALASALAASLPPVRRMRYGSAILIAALTFTVISADLVAGSSLALHTPMGYTAQVGARFAGMGNYAFGAWAASAIILVALLPWRGRALTFGAPLAAIAACSVVAAPMWGRNVGGTITFVATMVLLCLTLFGKKLSLVTTLIAGAIAAGSLSLVGFFDYLRPEEQQTHLGRFVGQIFDGEAFITILRKLAAAWGTVFNTPLTLLVAAAVMGCVLLWRRGVFADLTRAQNAALVGLGAVAAIGFLVNDSGIAVPGFVAVVGIPLFMTTLLREEPSRLILPENTDALPAPTPR